MEYTVNKLSKVSGITSRTLRYYDEIGLLKPARTNESGYRIYTDKEVDILQQILFYKSMGIKLKKIKEIVYSKKFDEIKSLKSHYRKLLDERKRIEKLIRNVEKTIKSKEENIKMKIDEKFEGLKKEIVEENEKKYGKEIREKYGDKNVEDSNRKLLNMSKEKYEEFQGLSELINKKLKEAINNNNSKLEKEVFDLHKKWLMYNWKEYSKEAHLNLAEMYVLDPRFKEYYDKIASGSAELLRNIIKKNI